MVDLSTIRPMAVRPIPARPAGFRTAPTRFSPTRCAKSAAWRTRGRWRPPPLTATITFPPTSTISPPSSIWTLSATRASISVPTRWAAPPGPLPAPTPHRHDYLSAYVNDLAAVVDMDAIRDARLNLCADPLGGAGVAYWARIAERYGLRLTIQNDHVDPTFRFMSVDWDGKIRMDCSSPYAMASLIALKDKYDLAFACDTDHDRHGIAGEGEVVLV